MTLDTKDITLLLVEDDEIDAMAITRSLSKMDVRNPLIRACDGLEALELLRSDAVPSPFIILLDLQMPRLNGLDFLEEIRQDPKLEKTIIFVLTTSKSDEDVTASYKKNIAGYFVKDQVGEKFLDMLKDYLDIVYFPEN